jgi:hypothetical protein
MDTKPKVKRVTKKTKESENAVVSDSTETSTSSVTNNVNVVEGDSTAPKTVPPKEIRLTDIPVVDEITALNLMVSFLGIAQKRGAYTIDEASKIWECIKKFQRPVEQSSA